MNIRLAYIKRLIPKRGRTSSKIDGGSVLIVAGGKSFKGAGILTALAATRSGAGYTHLMTDMKEYPWAKFPDFIIHKISLTTLVKHSNSTVAVGPGLGINNQTRRIIQKLLSMKTERVLLDADALSVLSTMKVKKLPATWILTPHEGELARLLKIPSSYVKKNRRKSLELLYEKYGCTILLKGADTLIIDQEGVDIVSEGVPALAKAGSGDVLLGMIAAFYAQGVSAKEASFLGSFIHGRCAQSWLKKGNDHLSLRPTDLIEEIPRVLLNLRK